jgi:hypothetical protein
MVAQVAAMGMGRRTCDYRVADYFFSLGKSNTNDVAGHRVRGLGLRSSRTPRNGVDRF